jgi:hypothetical protein
VGQDLADGRTVAEDRDALVAVAGGEARHRITDARREAVCRLSARDDVPALLGLHLSGERVTLGDMLAEGAALPVPQVHLAQIGLDYERQTEALGQWRRRLDRPPHGRHVDGGDVLDLETLGYPLRLLAALGVQSGIALAVHHREGLSDARRLGLTVPDEQQLGRALGADEAMLAVLVGLAHGCSWSSATPRRAPAA